MRGVLIVFVLSLLNLSPSISQIVGGLDETKLYAETKQVNQFFRRFNGEEDKKGNRLYSGDRQYRSFSLRKSYLRLLFDQDNAGLDKGLIQNFEEMVNSKSEPVFIDFHDGGWFAEIRADFVYKGKTTQAILFMKIEEERLGYKWVITNVYYEPFENHYIQDTSYLKKFLHPMSHELDFMNLKMVFEKKDSVQQFVAKEYKPDYLTLFLYELQNGNLFFSSVRDLKFHFFQIDNWYFEISYFNREGYNTGWLISNLMSYKTEEKQLIVDFVFYEN